MRKALFVVVLLAVWCGGARGVLSASRTSDIVTVDISPAHRISTFRPLDAIGSTVDKEPAGSIPRIYSKQNVQQILDAGLGWLSYRLYTEISVQDWHWNPNGSFSAGDRGYWTSDASTNAPPISDSYGYRLPHRGSTFDQGNNESYSRIDDGDPATYWKSDPYLTSTYTGESDRLHPQWVTLDLGKPQLVNAIRIEWMNPYAVHYDIAYWTGPDAINDAGNGTWHRFPSGTVVDGAAGAVTKKLASVPVSVRFVRVSMSQSSNTCDTHGSGDRRDCVGYAIGEISVGTIDGHGHFEDLVKHVASQKQTAVYASSTDSWHRASDRVRNQEQPGLDLIARSGLTRGMPAMYPVAMLYSTPANAVAEIRYMRARGYPISYVELGEEPDGQYVEPDDDAALYIQWARALHRYDPALKLGGPVLSGVNSDLQWWPDADGNVSWVTRFVAYLQRHHAMNELSFMSYEHYPFDGCEHGAALRHDLLVEPAIARGVAQAWRSDGVPSSVPMFVSEANFSAVNFTQTTMQIEGALWFADYVGASLSNGDSAVVYYQDEPVPLSRNTKCPADWGNLTMFAADANATIHARAAQFYGAQMVMRSWLEPGNGAHDLYPARTNVLANSMQLVTAYAVHRPDGAWSVMLVNKDDRAHEVAVRFTNESGATSAFEGSVARVTFGSDQYVWRARGALSRPDPNDPPVTTHLQGGTDAHYTIPPDSITVLRGRVGE